MKPALVWISGLIAVALVACSTGGSAPAGMPTRVAPLEPPLQAPVVNATPANTPEGAGASSAPTALADNVETHEDPADYQTDAATTTTLMLGGDSITIAGEGATAAGSIATIASAGTYVLSGALTDGQIVVDTGDDDPVTLVLNGVQLNSSTSAPINIVNGEKVLIQLAEGTTNTVNDAASYVYPSADVDEPNAAIFSKADLTIFGDGALNVTGNANDGIASKDGLIIAGGTITVNAVDDGIRGKDYLIVEGGALNVTAGGDGLKADNDEDPARGYISVTGGQLTIVAGGDGLQAETDLTLTAGSFTVTTGGGSSAPLASDASAKALKAGVNLVVDGGTYTLDAADDAVHSNASIVINAGAFTIATGDDGVHGETALTVNGGEINVTRSYEGLESMVITINGGTIDVVSSDDAINVAGGVDGSGFGGRGPRGGGGQDATTYTGVHRLFINGGTIYVESGGDGLDVNGAIEMRDGFVVVNGPTAQNNAALDFDGGFNQYGGFLVAAGSSGMAQGPGAASTQNGVLIFFSATQPAGTLVRIQDSSGQDVLTFAPAREFQSLVLSSAQLAIGQTYDILLGGTSTGTAADGLYADGTYSGGAPYASFTVQGAFTQVGTGGRGPGRP
ncbi:MAG TPA: carbohydrate-binding domain-containing protein [Anaerolineales bacterium]|nr:carbohydrate-binding domain-containing protein [Anaerolineales bacterium]